MSPAPPVIDASASLMEAAYRMHTENARRLVVVSSEKVVGVIREQDLFFEMENILSSIKFSRPQYIQAAFNPKITADEKGAEL